VRIAYPPNPARTPRIWRLALLGLGWLLIAAAPVVGVFPGPGGLLVAAAGVALLLKHSAWAKRAYVRAKRRWPRSGHRLDCLMRRASALRRRALGNPHPVRAKERRRLG
jgi:hypothetical protein